MRRTQETKTMEQDMIFERLKRSRFKQQKLPALRPVPTLTSTIIIFTSIGVFCIALGVVLLWYSNSVTEFVLRYDEDCGTTTPCFLNITLNETIKAPIMVHYQLNNFYQNHRKMLKSFSPEQLKGKNISYEELNKTGECSNAILNEHLGKAWAVNGFDLIPEAVAVPCGLMAMSYFTDRYIFMDENETVIEIDERNISWPEDRKLYSNMENATVTWPDYGDYSRKTQEKDTVVPVKLRRTEPEEPIDPEGPEEPNPEEPDPEEPEDPDYPEDPDWPEEEYPEEEVPENWTYVQWLNMTDEHFIVWMRPAAYPNFRKLWGRITEDLPPGGYILKINNTFDVSIFSGEKYFILSTVNLFGSKNTILAYSYIGVGCISILIAIGFFAWNLYVKRNKRIKI